jgi:hypothetical protein
MMVEMKTLLLAERRLLLSRVLSCLILLAVTIIAPAGAQNVLQIEGKPPVELPSMTPTEIRKAEIEQRKNEIGQRNNVQPSAPRSATKGDQVLIVREPRSAPIVTPPPSVKIEIDQRHRTPYPYHFEMKEGQLRKVRD